MLWLAWDVENLFVFNTVFLVVFVAVVPLTIFVSVVLDLSGKAARAYVFSCVVVLSIFFFVINDWLSSPLFLCFLSLQVFDLGSSCSFSWVISITSCSGSAVVSTFTEVSFDWLLFSNNSDLSTSTSM